MRQITGGALSLLLGLAFSIPALAQVEEVGSFETSIWPNGVEVSPDGTVGYVTHMFSGGVYTVQELNAGDAVGGNALGGRLNPGTLTQDGATLLLSDWSGGEITAVDTSDDSSSVIGAYTRPGRVELSPDGTEAYFADRNGFHVIDLATLTVVTSVALPGTGEIVQVSADGSTAAVTLSRGVAVVDLLSLTLVGDVGIGAPPTGLVVSADGSTAWVISLFRDSVYKVDLVGLLLAGDFDLEGNGAGVALSADEEALVVASTAGMTELLDAGTGEVLSALETPGISASSWGTDVEVAGGLALVTGTNAGSLFVIDVESGDLLQDLPLPRGSNITFSPDGCFAYVASTTLDRVTIFSLPKPEFDLRTAIGLVLPVVIEIADDPDSSYVETVYANWAIGYLNGALLDLDAGELADALRDTWVATLRVERLATFTAAADGLAETLALGARVDTVAHLEFVLGEIGMTNILEDAYDYLAEGDIDLAAADYSGAVITYYRAVLRADFALWVGP